MASVACLVGLLLLELFQGLDDARGAEALVGRNTVLHVAEGVELIERFDGGRRVSSDAALPKSAPQRASRASSRLLGLGGGRLLGRRLLGRRRRPLLPLLPPRCAAAPAATWLLVGTSAAASSTGSSSSERRLVGVDGLVRLVRLVPAGSSSSSAGGAGASSSS